MSATYVIILNAMVSEYPNCSFNLSANFKLYWTIYFSSKVVMETMWLFCFCLYM